MKITITEDLWTAFNQLETYKNQIPTLFPYNEIMVISDGIEARSGTITSDKERFMPWKTIEGKEIAPSAMPQLEVLFQGMLDNKILLDLIRHFMVFEQDRQDIHKKLAAYHQYHAVEKLTIIARELVDTVHKNVTIDWTLKDSVQAKLRVMVKRILKKYCYPPDKQKKATETVLEQAALLCRDWAEM